MTDFLNRESAPSLMEVISSAVRNALVETNTCLPGIVREFDEEKQEVSVEVTVRREFISRIDSIKYDIEEEDFPLLINVPVLSLQGAKFYLTTPIKEGDTCIVHFFQRDIDDWYVENRVKRPRSYRQHDLSDAYAIVGINNRFDKIENYNNTDIELRDASGDTRVRITPDDTIYIEANKDVNIICDNNANIDVGNNADIVVAQDTTIDVGNDVDMTVGNNVTAEVTNNLVGTIGNQADLTVTTQMNVTCPNTNWTGNIVHIGSYTQTGAHTVTGTSAFIGAVGITGVLTANPGAGGTSVFAGNVFVQQTLFAGTNVQATGSIIGVVEAIGGGKIMTLHVHSGVTSGPSYTGPPV